MSGRPKTRSTLDAQWETERLRRATPKKASTVGGELTSMANDLGSLSPPTAEFRADALRTADLYATDVPDFIEIAKALGCEPDDVALALVRLREARALLAEAGAA